MNTKRVLVPLDLLRDTSDALLYLQRAAVENPVCATLLYVVDLNITPPNQRVYHELCAEAEVALKRLVLFFFGNEQAAHVKVRVGRADEEILAEARASQAELIVMSGNRRRGWRGFFHVHTVQRVLNASPCPTLVLPPSRKAAPTPPLAGRENAAEINYPTQRGLFLSALSVLSSMGKKRLNRRLSA